MDDVDPARLPVEEWYRRRLEPKKRDALETILRRLYEVISFPAGGAPDWQGMRGVFSRWARITRVTPEGVDALELGSFEAMFTEMLESGFVTSFHEEELSRRVEVFGSVAHVLSVYETRRLPEAQSALSRGINSIQLLWDGVRWAIVSLVWDEGSVVATGRRARRRTNGARLWQSLVNSISRAVAAMQTIQRHLDDLRPGPADMEHLRSGRRPEHGHAAARVSQLRVVQLPRIARPSGAHRRDRGRRPPLRDAVPVFARVSLLRPLRGARGAARTDDRASRPGGLLDDARPHGGAARSWSRTATRSSSTSSRTRACSWRRSSSERRPSSGAPQPARQARGAHRGAEPPITRASGSCSTASTRCAVTSRPSKGCASCSIATRSCISTSTTRTPRAGLARADAGPRSTHLPDDDRVVVALSLNKAFSAAGGALVVSNPDLKRRLRACGGTMSFSGPIQAPMLGAAVASAKFHLSPELGRAPDGAHPEGALRARAGRGPRGPGHRRRRYAHLHVALRRGAKTRGRRPARSGTPASTCAR